MPRSCRHLYAPAGRLRRRGGRRAGEHRALRPDRLIRERGEGGHRLGELAEPQLGAPERRRAAEHIEDATEEVPGGEGVAEWLHRRAEALDAAEDVGERAVALDPRGERE